MAVSAAKALHLVLDRGTIARPAPLDRARKQRRAIEIRFYDCMGLIRSSGNRAVNLWPQRVRPGKRRHRPLLEVARLPFQARPVDGPPIKARRRSRLQPALPQPDFAKLRPESDSGPFIAPAAGKHLLTHEHTRVQKRASRNDERPAVDSADAGFECLDLTASNRQPERLANEKLNAAFADHCRYSFPVQAAIGLNARTLNGGALATV